MKISRGVHIGTATNRACSFPHFLLFLFYLITMVKEIGYLGKGEVRMMAAVNIRMILINTRVKESEADK